MLNHLFSWLLADPVNKEQWTSISASDTKYNKPLINTRHFLSILQSDFLKLVFSILYLNERSPKTYNSALKNVYIILTIITELYKLLPLVLHIKLICLYLFAWGLKQFSV